MFVVLQPLKDVLLNLLIRKINLSKKKNSILKCKFKLFVMSQKDRQKEQK